MNARQAQQMAAARGCASVGELITRLRRTATELRNRPADNRKERSRLDSIADINDREADSLTQYQ